MKVSSDYNLQDQVERSSLYMCSVTVLYNNIINNYLYFMLL